MISPWPITRAVPIEIAHPIAPYDLVNIIWNAKLTNEIAKYKSERNFIRFRA